MANDPTGGVPTPPHDKEAEQGMLGAILQNAAALPMVRGILDADALYAPQHRVIFQAMEALHAENQPIDTITLGARLRSDGNLAAAGGLTYIGELIDLTPAASNVQVYAGIVAEKARARKVYQASIDFARQIGERGTLDGSLGPFRTLLDDTMAGARGVQATSMRDGLVDFMEWLEAPQDPTSLIRTFTALDEPIGNFEAGAVHTIAARAGVGKTTILAQIAIDNALRLKAPGLLFSLEMPVRQLIGRALSARSGVEGARLLQHKNDDLTQGDWDGIAAALSDLAEVPLHWYEPQRPMTVEQMEAVARHHVRAHGIRYIVVDHLRMIRGNSREGTAERDQTKRIMDLSVMAKTLNLPVILAAQINRAGAGPNLARRQAKEGDKPAPEPRPRMEHLEWSGAIEQQSQTIVILHDPNPNDAGAHDVECLLVKNRNGAKGDVRLTFTPWRFTFR